MTPEEKAQVRADFRIKFRILRNAYGDRYEIPGFRDDEELDVIYASYDRYVRQIYIDQNADDYKVYIIILFVGLELFGTKVLGLDFSGYTLNQLSIMNRYERLLIELGEKNYTNVGSSWPVEIRICLLALFNAIVFVLVKYLCSHLGPDVANVVQSMVTGFLSGKGSQNARPAPTGASQTVPPPARENSFDLGNILGALGGMFGQNRSPTTAPVSAEGTRARRRPQYRE